ncbi:hypothetical protein ANN_19952 [Periplaneta americana]|uniref:Uncharacterized protein n=1 Tax=Periplaneta americana TaxID=6978 RepID=A0ABQ8SCA9_PERAM|nr:hypothetical protein ANN_19952 [Periplaneta americana]
MQWSTDRDSTVIFMNTDIYYTLTMSVTLQRLSIVFLFQELTDKQGNCIDRHNLSGNEHCNTHLSAKGTITSTIVVKLLADFFGLPEETSHQIHLIKFEQIKKALLKKDLIVEKLHILVHEDALSSDEDIDSDFRDDTPRVTIAKRHENSGSSCSPSPKRAQTKFPDGYLEDTYKVWTKQPRAKYDNVDSPQLCLSATHQIRDEDVLNADQSLFEKELHSGRSLAVKGMKHIIESTGSVSARTHSYMTMPEITMAETLLQHMYVLMSEATRKFPVQMTLILPNTKAYHTKSANTSKQDLQVFLKDILWLDLTEKKHVLLLVD